MTVDAGNLFDYFATLLWFENQVKQTVTGVSLIYGIRGDPVDMVIYFVIAKGPRSSNRAIGSTMKNSIASVWQSYRLIGAGTGVLELTDEYIDENLKDDVMNDVTAPGESINLYVASEVEMSFRISGTLEIKETWTQRIFADDLTEHEQDIFAEEDFELLQHDGCE
ncbi:hypothetical protein KA005_37355 [bacterium]|nr:hypothetical protein [bacterium]